MKPDVTDLAEWRRHHFAVRSLREAHPPLPEFRRHTSVTQWLFKLVVVLVLIAAVLEL